MLRTAAAFSLALAFLATMAPTADACSARGRFCGYPAWAANAFEDSTGRAPASAILTTAPRPARKAR